MRFTGLTFDPDFDKHAQKHFEQMQDYVDKSCIMYMRDYVPVADKKFKNAGKMRASHKVEKPGVIINTEPRARREYYTNKGGSGGKRGKLWFECMKADHKNDILKGAKK